MTTAETLARRARTAAGAMQAATTQQKNRALRAIADALANPTTRDAITTANAGDLEAAVATGVAPAMVDRLRLDGPRLDALARAVREIEALPDPVGGIDGLTARPSGIVVGRMRVPLGVVLIVYESRPNVTVDAAALCLKAGNVVVLRGGKEALRTNRALAVVVRAALVEAGLPEDGVVFVDDPDRELLYALLKRTNEIDLAIPRGGTALIDAVNEHARIPVIQHYQGICHVYVHAAADLDVAERVVVNAKVSRPGVCNAAECVVVDESVAAAFLPRLAAALVARGVELRGDARARTIVPTMTPATDADFDTEFLALTLAVRVVDGFDEALAFLARHGSRHTESVITRDHDVAMAFLRRVDASCVLVNASTRFNDGGELGLGAELGISTSKLHAYGPMGLEELTTRKFVVLGHGETRGSPP
jgi:glutamate-5-semialdehyde dehydrogenase